MALYHFNRTVIQRSAGKSAAKALSYIHRTAVKDEYLGKTYSFPEEPGEVVRSQMYIPEDAPLELCEIADRFKTDPGSAVEMFANALDRVENDFIGKRYRTFESREAQRGRAQTSFMEVLGLQSEFTLEENQFLVDRYVMDVYGSRGLPATAALHMDEDNPHVHILVSQRPVACGKYSEHKDREVMSKAGLKASRSHWAEINNDLFRFKGMNTRITAESFKNLGIDLEPTIKVGDDRFVGPRGDVVEHNRLFNFQIQDENAQKLLMNPETVLNKLQAGSVSFTKGDMEREFGRFFGGQVELIEGLCQEALESKRLIALEKNLHGEMMYATREYLESERNLIECADALKEKTSHPVSAEDVRAALKGGEIPLNRGQKAVIKETLLGSDLTLIQGLAGAGKSTAMERVVEAYQGAGYTVFCAAWDGSAADELGLMTGCESRTLKSWLNKWENFEERFYGPQLLSTLGSVGTPAFREQLAQQLGPKSVVILDEAGTVDVPHFSQLLGFARAAGAKVVALGDAQQTSPIGPGAAFEALCARHTPSLLDEIMRQKQPWMRDATTALSRHDVATALCAYEDRERLHWVKPEDLHTHLVDAYLSSNTVLSQRVMLAPTNKDVDFLNQMVSQKFKESGAIPTMKTLDVKTKKGEAKQIDVGVGSRVMFLDNDNMGTRVKTLEGEGTGVKNGALGYVTHMRGKTLKVALDGGRHVKLDVKEYPYLSLGYAMTIHKSQGKTVDESFVLANGTFSASQTYVALSRHRRDCQIFVDSKRTLDLHKLIPQMSRLTPLDFISKDRLYGEEITHQVMDAVHTYKDLTIESHTQYGEARLQAERKSEKIYDQMEYTRAREAESDRKDVASFLLSKWDMAKNYARDIGKSLYELEVETGTRPKALTRSQKDAHTHIERYKELGAMRKALATQARKDPSKASDAYQEMSKLGIERQALAHTFSLNPTLYKPLLAENYLSYKTVTARLTKLSLDPLKEDKSQGKAISNIEALKRDYVKDDPHRPLKLAPLPGSKTGATMPYMTDQKQYSATEILTNMPLDRAIEFVNTYTPYYFNQKINGKTGAMFGKTGPKGTTLTIGPNKSGLMCYQDFAEGTNGTLLTLIRNHTGMSLPEVCSTLGPALHLNPNYSSEDQKISYVRDDTPQSRDAILSHIKDRKSEREDDIALLKVIATQAKPAKGTLTEDYLKTRGIHMPLSEDIRFNDHPKFGPQMIVVARDETDDLTAIQVLSLNPKTCGKRSPSSPKISHGLVSGSSVMIQKGDPKTVFLAEGVETALSLREAGVNGTIKATLGKSNFLNAALGHDPKTRLIIVADNDGSHWTHDKSLTKTIETLQHNGYKPDVLFIPYAPYHSKFDLNDLLKDAHGINLIRNAVAQLPTRDLDSEIQKTLGTTQPSTVPSNDTPSSKDPDGLKDAQTLKDPHSLKETPALKDATTQREPFVIPSSLDRTGPYQSDSPESSKSEVTLNHTDTSTFTKENLGSDPYEVSSKKSLPVHPEARKIENSPLLQPRDEVDLYVQRLDLYKAVVALKTDTGAQQNDVDVRRLKIHLETELTESAFKISQDPVLMSKIHEKGLEKYIERQAEVHRQEQLEITKDRGIDR